MLKDVFFCEDKFEGLWVNLKIKL